MDKWEQIWLLNSFIRTRDKFWTIVCIFDSDNRTLTINYLHIYLRSWVYVIESKSKKSDIFSKYVVDIMAITVTENLYNSNLWVIFHILIYNTSFYWLISLSAELQYKYRRCAMKNRNRPFHTISDSINVNFQFVAITILTILKIFSNYYLLL